MLIRIKDAAEYVRTSKFNKFILAILRSPLKLYTFTDERNNRVSRYVAIINEYKKGTSIADIKKNSDVLKLQFIYI